jgi:hypothetical protein
MSTSMQERFTSIAQERNFRSSPKQTSKVPAIVIGSLILLSLGAFVVLATKNNKKQSENTNNGEENQDTVATSSVEATVTTTTKSEENTPSETGKVDHTLFTQNDQNVGDETVTGAKIQKVETSKEDGFYRITFPIDGSTSFPYATASIKTSSKLIQFTIKGIDSDNSGISVGNGQDITNSVVSTIFHEVTGEANTSKYSIGIKKTTNFYLHTLDNPQKIVLDIEEQTIDDGTTQTFSFSQDPQSIVGDASGDVITVSGLSYSNQGDVFRILFRLGTTGTGTLPNVGASIVDYEGGKAIKVEISNLSSDFAAQNNYNQAMNDKSVSGMVGSFSSHVSTYYIKLKALHDYQLYYRTAPTQLIIDVKH